MGNTGHRGFLIWMCAAALSMGGEARTESPSDILIIANTSVSTNSSTADEIRDIFLQKRSDWSAGGRAVPIQAVEGSKLRDEFCERVLRMSPSEEQKYWQERKIRFGYTPPVEFENTLRAVYRLRGSVSYIFREQYREGVVKVLLVLPSR